MKSAVELTEDLLTQVFEELEGIADEISEEVAAEVTRNFITSLVASVVASALTYPDQLKELDKKEKLKLAAELLATTRRTLEQSVSEGFTGGVAVLSEEGMPTFTYACSIAPVAKSRSSGLH